MEAQPKLVTCRLFLLFLSCLFVCWHFNGLICLTERFTRTFWAVSSISVIGGFRNLFSKAPSCQSTLQTRSPQPPLCWQRLSKASSRPLSSSHFQENTVTANVQARVRLFTDWQNRELCFPARPVQSGEAETVAESAPKCPNYRARNLKVWKDHGVSRGGGWGVLSSVRSGLAAR